MIGSAPPRAVPFDCWSTLLTQRDQETPKRLRAEALVRAASELELRLSMPEAVEWVRRGFAFHNQAWEQGAETGARDIARWIFRELGTSASEIEAQLCREFEHAVLQQEVRPLDGARRTLELLAERGVGRALICDTGFSPGRVVRQLLEREGLLGFLPVQIFSDEVGVPKPSPRIFEAALAGLGIEPGDSVHVGDLKRTDVAGARRLGMGTVRLRDEYDDPSDLPEADRVVDSHRDLQVILQLC